MNLNAPYWRNLSLHTWWLGFPGRSPGLEHKWCMDWSPSWSDHSRRNSGWWRDFYSIREGNFMMINHDKLCKKKKHDKLLGLCGYMSRIRALQDFLWPNFGFLCDLPCDSWFVGKPWMTRSPRSLIRSESCEWLIVVDNGPWWSMLIRNGHESSFFPIILSYFIHNGH